MTTESTREATLGRVPLLVGLDAPALRSLAAASHIATVDKGEILFLEGEPSVRMFVVLSGRLRIYRNSVGGAELVLANLGAGESIGELSVIDQLPRSANAQALERSRVISVPAENLRAELRRAPAAAMAVASQLAGTVRRLTGTTSDFVFLDLPHRLAKYLLSLAPQDARDDATVVLPASQSGVAAQLGVTRQSLNQALGHLGEKSLIVVDGRAVRLLDLTALENF